MEEKTQSGIVKKFLYINRRAPHGTIYAHEALETVLIGAAFEQDVTLIFIDDGVFQLKKNQDTSEIGTKNFSKTYAALEMYDVEKLYVEKKSLEQRGLTQDDLSVDAIATSHKGVSHIPKPSPAIKFIPANISGLTSIHKAKTNKILAIAARVTPNKIKGIRFPLILPEMKEPIPIPTGAVKRTIPTISAPYSLTS